MDIAEEYRKFCQSRDIPFARENHVRPYDDTTLFCPAGMQQFKKQFQDPTICGKTVANIQPCVRLNDYADMGDGTHLLYFNMIGLFSFRDMTLEEGIDFWMTFVQEILGKKVDYITIHPDKLEQWRHLYDQYNVEIRTDPECTWSDGSSETAYCTEFYIQGIEIGNIVNPGGDCLDVGFGYERLDHLVNGTMLNNRQYIMRETLHKMISSGFLPGPMKQGSIVRRLIRDYIKLLPEGLNEDDPYYSVINEELLRQHNQQEQYTVLSKAKKRQGKSKEWWKSTFGIDIDLVE